MGIRGSPCSFSLTDVELQHKRKDGITTFNGTQTFQHRHTRNEVESADAIDR